MKLLDQACWEGGQKTADQVLRTLRNAAQIRVIDLTFSPLNPAAVEQLIEAVVPMEGLEQVITPGGQTKWFFGTKHFMQHHPFGIDVAGKHFSFRREDSC